MKSRLIALLACTMVLVLCLQSLVAAAESDYTYFPESEDYVGSWRADAYTLEIVHMEDDRALFRCIVTQYNMDDTGARWIYNNCSYDDIGMALASVQIGTKSLGAFDEAGEFVPGEQIYDDGAASFKLGEDGKLVWTDFKETPGSDEIVFERCDAEEAGIPADGLHASIQHEIESPEWIVNLPAAQDARQLFVVAGLGMDKTTATISMHRKGEDGTWKQILSTPGYVGLNGLCLDEDHAEGCAQTPIGVYHFNKAFGIAADPGCAIPYIQVDDDTYWSGDPDRRYNEMVDIKDYPDLVMDDSEHIMDYEYQYQYCLNISFNEEGTPGRGSAIFLHCLGPAKPYTGGCVAIPENIMKLVMQNVTEDCVVVIDTLENLGGSF